MLQKNFYFALLIITVSIAVAKWTINEKGLACFVEGECVHSPFLGKQKSKVF